MTDRTHPASWWVWALLIGSAVARTTNPVLLVLVASVLGLVVAYRRPAEPWGRSYYSFLKLAALVILVRTVFHVLLGSGSGTTVLLELPELDLGDSAAGVRIGGPVTEEGLVAAITDALRLAAMLACVGAANSLASPRRLLRSLPAALYEVSVAAVVALSVAPRLVERSSEMRRARELRGEATRGLRSVRRVLIPVVEEALEGSMNLAASMDARGYGRNAQQSRLERRVQAGLVLGGVAALALGSFSLLATEMPPAGSWALVGLGVATCMLVTRIASRRVRRTRYMPDRWGANEAVIVISGLMVALGVTIAGSMSPGSLEMTIAPVRIPEVPPLLIVAILLGGLPALFGPGRRRTGASSGSGRRNAVVGEFA